MRRDKDPKETGSAIEKKEGEKKNRKEIPERRILLSLSWRGHTLSRFEVRESSLPTALVAKLETEVGTDGRCNQ